MQLDRPHRSCTAYCKQHRQAEVLVTQGTQCVLRSSLAGEARLALHLTSLCWQGSQLSFTLVIAVIGVETLGINCYNETCMLYT